MTPEIILLIIFMFGFGFLTGILIMYLALRKDMELMQAHSNERIMELNEELNEYKRTASRSDIFKRYEIKDDD